MRLTTVLFLLVSAYGQAEGVCGGISPESLTQGLKENDVVFSGVFNSMELAWENKETGRKFYWVKFDIFDSYKTDAAEKGLDIRRIFMSDVDAHRWEEVKEGEVSPDQNEYLVFAKFQKVKLEEPWQSLLPAKLKELLVYNECLSYPMNSIGHVLVDWIMLKAKSPPSKPSDK